MTTISIIGSGNMAAAIGTRAAAHGHSVEIIGRDPEKSQSLADRIGHGATVGTYGSAPAGEIVIVAILFADAVDVVSHFGDALAGRILVDISNPFTADASAVVTAPGDSIAERIAAAAPADAHVIKAFNTIFGGVIADDQPLDGFFAGDSAAAKATFAEFLESIGMQPRDAGPLRIAHALEWAGILLVGIAGSGAGFDVALKAEVR